MNGAFVGSMVDAGRGHDAHQRVVHRPLQRAAVADHFGGEVQDVRRKFFALARDSVATLAQHVEEQDGSLPGIQPVFLDGTKISPTLHGSASLLGSIRIQQVVARGRDTSGSPAGAMSKGHIGRRR